MFTGILKYHYLVDFYAGSASVVAGIPLPVVYFRFLLPFCWLFVLVGLRGILKRHNPSAGVFWLAGAFALFFLSHENQVSHLTFRDNMFALGLAVLGMSTLWAGLAGDAFAWAALAAAATGPATFAKAPGGSLYAAFVCLCAALYWRAGRLSLPRAAALCAIAASCWLTVSKTFLIEPGAGTVLMPALKLASL